MQVAGPRLTPQALMVKHLALTQGKRDRYLRGVPDGEVLPERGAKPALPV